MALAVVTGAHARAGIGQGNPELARQGEAHRHLAHLSALLVLQLLCRQNLDARFSKVWNGA